MKVWVGGAIAWKGNWPLFVMPIFLNFPLTSSVCHVKGHASLPLEDMNKKIYQAKETSAIVKIVEKRKEIRTKLKDKQ